MTASWPAADVDVFIPCYNYGRYLRRCVESVLSQAGVRVRVLIIDDASTDDSAAVAAALAREDKRVEVAVHASNRGHVATYNDGLAWITAQCALLLSADDLLLPGALWRAVTIMTEHPTVSLVYGRQVLFSGDPPRADEHGTGIDARYDIVRGAEFIKRVCAQADNPVATPTAVVRTSIQRQIGRYSHELPHTNDMEMWLRLAAHGDVAIVRADQALKRQHAVNMQLAYIGSVREFEQRLTVFNRFFTRYGGAIEGRQALQALIRDRLSTDAMWSASHAFDHGDVTACERLCAFALSLQPGLTDSVAWSRLAWKRRLGVRAWGMMRPVVDTLRGASWRRAS